MGVIFLITLSLAFSLGAVSGASNKTEAEENSRGMKALGIFSVVKFPNSQCVGTNSLNGTCYTKDECTAKSGSSAGSCASGFGVCCTFSLACGSSTTENSTYHTVTTFSSTANKNPCTYKVCPSSSASICKLRLDFETFSIAGPFTGGTLATFVANPLFPQGAMAGKCIYDSFTIQGTRGQINTLCGYNTGQHIYVPSLSTCNTMTIKIDTERTYTRSWNVAVKQIPCGSEYANHNCLQYLTGNGPGTFTSFNYETANGVVVGATVMHLADQNYDICFRQERGYCAICFDAAINTPAIAVSFGVSGNVHASIQKSGMDTQCNGVDLQAPQPFGAFGDYISISNGVADPVTSSLTVGNHRYCGLTFNGLTDTITVDTVCSFTAPFKWGVTFSDAEYWANPGAAALKTENFANAASFGGLGFYMNWFQQKC